MGETDPKLRKDAVRTRRAILDAAHDLLQRDPEVSHAEIARVAGVGRASVYRHFPERQDIVVALLDELVGRVEEFAAAQEEPATMVDLMRAMAREQARSLGVISVMRRDFAPGQLGALNDRVLELFAEPLARAQREGLVRADLALEEVPLLLSMVEGALNQVTDPVDRGEASSRALDFVLQGVLTADRCVSPPAPRSAGSSAKLVGRWRPSRRGNRLVRTPMNGLRRNAWSKGHLLLLAQLVVFVLLGLTQLAILVAGDGERDKGPLEVHPVRIAGHFSLSLGRKASSRRFAERFWFPWD